MKLATSVFKGPTWGVWVALMLAAYFSVTSAAEKASPKPAKAKPAAKPTAKGKNTGSQSKEPRETTFDDIKLNLAKDEVFKRSMLTPDIVSLDKRRIRIRGYILPTFQQTGITQFVLVRDNRECCFGPGAALHDCILVSMQEGKTTDYSVAPVAVEGTFKIDELLDPDGKQLAIYQMDGEKVE